MIMVWTSGQKNPPVEMFEAFGAKEPKIFTWVWLGEAVEPDGYVDMLCDMLSMCENFGDSLRKVKTKRLMGIELMNMEVGVQVIPPRLSQICLVAFVEKF
jgi:hypothetical protein